jgi:hypothetical protein
MSYSQYYYPGSLYKILLLFEEKEGELTPTVLPGIYPEKKALVAGTHGAAKVLDTTL